MWYCIIEPHEVQDSQINIIIAIKHSKHISIAIKGTGGLPSRHNLHHNLNRCSSYVTYHVIKSSKSSSQLTDGGAVGGVA